MVSCLQITHRASATILSVACFESHRGGAAMSAQDLRARTALHLAAERGSQKMIKLLIGQGAEASPVDRLGRTPLHLSAQGYGEATKLLVDEGVQGLTTRDLTEEKGLERATKALDVELLTGYEFDGRLTRIYISYP
jgi:hypothetical protein